MTSVRVVLVSLVALTALAGASSQSTGAGPSAYQEAPAKDYEDCYVRSGQSYDVRKVTHCDETRCASTGRDDSELPEGLRWAPCPPFPMMVDE